MPGENIYDWSTTATNNGNADSSINWAEGQPRASVNNSARSVMAAIAKQRDLHNGSIVTGGSADAQTFFSGMNFTSVPTGFTARLKIGPSLNNTGAATLNMDNIGAVAILNPSGVALSGGELVGGKYVTVFYDGTNWLLDAGSIAISTVLLQKFTASGTYTPTVGMKYAIVECIGGGGGGGSCFNGLAGRYIGGGGGGSGGYSRARLTATQIGASQVVTIGAAGTGGNVSANDAGAGGTTSLGVLVIANGGAGGSWANDSGSFVGAGGAGGAAGTGDIAAAGAPGGKGFFSIDPNGLTIAAAGLGGSSVLGGGGVGIYAQSSASNGVSASQYGSGGGGAMTANAAANASGGVGSAGICIVTEYI